jgi:hypothetical protein
MEVAHAARRRDSVMFLPARSQKGKHFAACPQLLTRLPPVCSILPVGKRGQIDTYKSSSYSASPKEGTVRQSGHSEELPGRRMRHGPTATKGQQFILILTFKPRPSPR